MLRKLWVITKRTFLGYTGDNCSQLAAAISYYVLFSIAPLTIFTVSVFGVVLTAGGREQVVNRVLDIVPLTQTEGRTSVEDAINSIKSVGIVAAAVSLAFLLWTASSVFGSIRRSLNVIWRAEEHRPFAQAKLIDAVQVVVLGSILLASLVLTGVLRWVRAVSAAHVGPLAGSNPLWEVPPVVLPGTLTCVVFLLLYRVVPAVRPRWRDIIPGALLATVLFEALKNSFALYVAYFNNFDVVYGSLAGILLFLLYTFLSANILLIGAELSRTLMRYHARDFDPEIFPTQPMPPVTTRAFRAFKALFVRDEA